MLTHTECCSLVLLRASEEKIQQLEITLEVITLSCFFMLEHGRSTGKGKSYWHVEFGPSGNKWWQIEAPHRGTAMYPPQKYYSLFHVQVTSLLPLFLGSEAVWRRDSHLQWNLVYPYPSQDRNTLSLKITSCVEGSSPPPSSQVRKRQVVPWHHPAQPQGGDNANAKPEQTRMGNKSRVSAGLSQSFVGCWY